MKETAKLLDQVFSVLCEISVKGADVERMAMAKMLVRQAAESLKTKNAECETEGAKA